MAIPRSIRNKSNLRRSTCVLFPAGVDRRRGPGQRGSPSVRLVIPAASEFHVKLLIDECLHTSLVKIAHEAGHTADHVAHRGLGGLKDWQLMRVIREQEYTLVTNNRSDFLGLHGKEALHAGVIVV